MYKSIKELDIYISDGNYSSKYPRSGEFVDRGIPFIRGNNMIDGEIVDEDMYHITEEKHRVLLKGHVQTGDVLITTRGNIGQIAIIPERYNDSNINAQIVLLRVNKDKLYNRYLFWALQSQKAGEQYLSLQTGTALKQLPVGKLEQIKIKYVDLKSQYQVAEILDKVYQIIKNRRNELQVLDEIIKARFVEMFGDPNRSDKYGTRKLSSCVADKADMVDGPFGSQVNTKVDYIENGEIPVIRTVNVKMMSFSPVDLKYMTREKYETVIRSQVLPGDVILTKVGTIGNVCIFPDTFEEAVLSTTGSCRIRVDKTIVNKEFFAYNLLYLKEILLEIASAGVQPFLNMNHVKNIDILDVPLDKQKEFAAFVEQIDKSKAAIQKALDKTQLLFDSLMQKYFG